VFHTRCSPSKRPGGLQEGEHEWIYKIPLHDGRFMELHCGKTGRDSLLMMARQEALDDEVDAIVEGAGGL
jgi:hypothetical protein